MSAKPNLSQYAATKCLARDHRLSRMYIKSARQGVRGGLVVDILLATVSLKYTMLAEAVLIAASLGARGF